MSKVFVDFLLGWCLLQHPQWKRNYPNEKQLLAIETLIELSYFDPAIGSAHCLKTGTEYPFIPESQCDQMLE